MGRVVLFIRDGCEKSRFVLQSLVACMQSKGFAGLVVINTTYEPKLVAIMEKFSGDHHASSLPQVRNRYTFVTGKLRCLTVFPHRFFLTRSTSVEVSTTSAISFQVEFLTNSLKRSLLLYLFLSFIPHSLLICCLSKKHYRPFFCHMSQFFSSISSSFIQILFLFPH